MIEASTPPGSALVARLTAKAELLAKARAETRRRDSRHWRFARLLWPLFGKER